jgi:ferritin-like metal-binding protein YciE
MHQSGAQTRDGGVMSEQKSKSSISGNDLVLSWLNDALAMENALAVVLKHRIKDAKGFPALEAMDRLHLEETLQHADRVKQCIARLGSKPSTAKSMLGTAFGMMQAPMTGLTRDEVVKNCLMDYAAEQFEVASYSALIAAANQIGDTQTASICEQNMREDQAMADAIMMSLPDVIAVHMGNLDAFPAGRAVSGEMMGQPAAESPESAAGM